MRGIKADTVAGCIFVLIALAFGVQSLQYDRGDFFRMGAGLFPLTVSVILLALGAAILVTASDSKIRAFSLRSLCLVLLAPIAFALIINQAGLVLAALVLALLGCFASRSMTVIRALATSVVLTAMTVAIFVWGLHAPIAAFGPWFTGSQ